MTLLRTAPTRASTWSGLRTAPRTLATLGLLTAVLPANLALTAAALIGSRVVRSRVVRSRIGPPPDVVAERPLTIMVSGGKMTKALQLARSFHAAGHRVVLVETGHYRLTGHRFSRAVDRFLVVPRPQDPAYAAALLDIVLTEGVDVYVPVCSPVASYHDAAAAVVLREHCEVLSLDADLVRALDDKHEFAVIAASLGLSVPDTHLITDPAQVLDFDFAATGKTYVLKSIAYDPVRRLDLTGLPRPTAGETAAFVARLPISPGNPWILQEFVRGREYCTHTTAREGRVQVYCCCPSSAFQINYEMVDNPAIQAWVEHFVGALGLTGQVSFDFMEGDDGRVYAIECNPRTHSAITMFYDHPGLARAYLESGVPVVTPLPTSRPTYWLYHEVWRLLTRPSSYAERLRVIARGKDAIFDWSDPLPFLLVHHLQVPSLLVDSLRRLRGWIRVDFNIGKLVEAGGD